MEITNIRIFAKGNPDSKVKAVAHVVFNNSIVLRRIHLVAIEGSDKLKIVYPVYHLQTQGYRRAFYPATEESTARLNEAIYAAYEKSLKDGSDDAVDFVSTDAPEIPFTITGASVYVHNEEGSSTMAKVNVELDGEIWLRGMYLMRKPDGSVYLRMPRRTHADGRRIDLYHPRTQAARDMLTEAVMPLYEAALKAADEAVADDTATPPDVA